jgi:hypothetical protein
MKSLSSWGERGGDTTRETVPPLSFRELALKTIKRHLQESSTWDVIDSFSFGIHQDLAQSRVVPDKTSQADCQAIEYSRRGSEPCRRPESRRGGGMQWGCKK